MTTRQTPSPGYQALVSGVAAWVDPHQIVARVEGARAGRMLNGLFSADLEALEPGDSTLSFVLTSKGRPVAVPRVIRLKDSFLLDVSRRAVPGLLDHFSTYLPPRFASVTILEQAIRASLLGPGARDVAAGLSIDGDHVRVQRPAEEGPGFDFYVLDGSGEGTVESAALAAGGAVAEPGDHETWRIERGIPRFGVDITAENLPQETGLVARAVSFEKGCYTGQEVVARIHYRGQVNRHLRGLRLAAPDSDRPFSPGTELTLNGRPVGVVTSTCASPRFGPIALGYVRREVAPGDLVEADSDPPIACEVTAVPFT